MTYYMSYDLSYDSSYDMSYGSFIRYDLQYVLRSVLRFVLRFILTGCLPQKDENRIEPVCDPEQFLFVENSIRGGVSIVNHRHATENNEFVPDYNPDDPTSWILFVYANNLYSHAMSQTLPTGYFQFLSQKEIEEFDM